ncbi:MAG: hypothetical protein EXR79_12500 [Myxococcales bacterium]|nr:hypothetical protein [Myxococcales bacterium]
MLIAAVPPPAAASPAAATAGPSIDAPRTASPTAVPWFEVLSLDDAPELVQRARKWMNLHGFAGPDLALRAAAGAVWVQWRVEWTADRPGLGLPGGERVRWQGDAARTCVLSAGEGQAVCDAALADTARLALALRAVAGVDAAGAWQIEALHGGAGAGEFDLRLVHPALPGACVVSLALDGTLRGATCGSAQVQAAGLALPVRVGGRALWHWSPRGPLQEPLAPAASWPRFVVPWRPAGLAATGAAIEAGLGARGLQPVGPGEIELARSATGTQCVAARIPVAAAPDADVRVLPLGAVKRTEVLPEADIERALGALDLTPGCWVAQVLGPSLPPGPVRSVTVALRQCLGAGQ